MVPRSESPSLELRSLQCAHAMRGGGMVPRLITVAADAAAFDAGRSRAARAPAFGLDAAPLFHRPGHLLVDRVGLLVAQRPFVGHLRHRSIAPDGVLTESV